MFGFQPTAKSSAFVLSAALVASTVFGSVAFAQAGNDTEIPRAGTECVPGAFMGCGPQTAIPHSRGPHSRILGRQQLRVPGIIGRTSVDTYRAQEGDNAPGWAFSMQRPAGAPEVIGRTSVDTYRAEEGDDASGGAFAMQRPATAPDVVGRTSVDTYEDCVGGYRWMETPTNGESLPMACSSY